MYDWHKKVKETNKEEDHASLTFFNQLNTQF